MSWATCSALPVDTAGYQRAQALYREQTMLKVLLERDVLTEQHYEAKEETPTLQHQAAHWPTLKVKKKKMTAKKM